MESMNSLLIKRNDVATLLSIEEFIAAVEQAFKLRTLGEALTPGILGIHSAEGGFHIKAGILSVRTPSENPERQYFVAKTNANFPQNMRRNGLPTIQGIIAVSDAQNGRLLALMDSIEITIIRTGAATAVAAKYLSSPDARTATICGCGNQGRISLKAIKKIRPLETVYAYDIDQSQAKRFAKELSEELKISVISTDHLANAIRESQICVTCTPSSKFFLKNEYIMPGTFIAAVGADSEHKQEIEPVLFASGKIVVDSMEQCASIGELHHALELGIMTRDKVHAEIGEIITGQKLGWNSNGEVIIFDSTGTGLQDVAAASIVYEKAVQKGIGVKFNFAE